MHRSTAVAIGVLALVVLSAASGIADKFFQPPGVLYFQESQWGRIWRYDMQANECFPFMDMDFDKGGFSVCRNGTRASYYKTQFDEATGESTTTITMRDLETGQEWDNVAEGVGVLSPDGYILAVPEKDSASSFLLYNVINPAAPVFLGAVPKANPETHYQNPAWGYDGKLYLAANDRTSSDTSPYLGGSIVRVNPQNLKVTLVVSRSNTYFSYPKLGPQSLVYSCSFFDGNYIPKTLYHRPIKGKATQMGDPVAVLDCSYDFDGTTIYASYYPWPPYDYAEIIKIDVKTGVWGDPFFMGIHPILAYK